MSKALTIAEDLEGVVKYKPYKGTFGIEIETESLDSYIEPLCLNWKVKEDHSLRNFGREYILNKPCSFEDVGKVLKEFDTVTKEAGIKFIEDRMSTSVHVHVNMQNETFLTLGNFVVIFTFFEDILIDFCGDKRRSNMFCLTTRYAEGIYRRLQKFFEGLDTGSYNPILQLNEDTAKYSALNIVPLKTLGSVEIRTMRGITDIDKIKQWIGIINSMLQASKMPGLTPRIVLDYFQKEPGMFFDLVFGEYADLLRKPDLFQRTEKSLWYVGSIVGEVDWFNLPGKVRAKTEEVIQKQKEQEAEHLKKVAAKMNPGELVFKDVLVKHPEWFHPGPAIQQEIQEVEDY